MKFERLFLTLLIFLGSFSYQELSIAEELNDQIKETDRLESDRLETNRLETDSSEHRSPSQNISSLNKPLVIKASNLEYYPIEFTKIFTTNDHQLDVDDVDFISDEYWSLLEDDFDYNAKSIYWLKLNLELDTSDKQSQILEWILSPGFWFNATVYSKPYEQPLKDKQAVSNKPLWEEKNLSVFQPLDKREIKHNTPFIDLFKSSTKIQLLIKLHGYRHGRTPEFRNVKIISLKKLRFDDQRELYFQGIYFGIALALVGFHFVLWLWFRERTYFWLVLMGSVSPVFFHALYGFALTHFWPNWVSWNEYSAHILGIATAILYLRFSAVYLNLDQQYPRLNTLLNVGIMLSVISSLTVFYDFPLISNIPPLLQSLLSIVILWVSIKLSIKGHRYAWYFVAGNVLILVSFILWSLSQTQIIRVDYLPLSVAHMTQAAASIQAVLLALGMVDRMQSMKQVILENKLLKEKQEKQQAKKTEHLMKVQNAELASSNFALKEIDQLKDEFLAKTSHEINTPLNGILGLSEVLINDDDEFSKEERKEYLELIYSRGEHLRDLVVELLEFTKTQRDVVKLYNENFDVVSHIQKIILTFESVARKKGLTIDFDPSTEVTVYADIRRFRQIISILIDNAIKYTDKGGIRITVNEANDFSEVKVSDTGVGISQKELPNIFEAFKQIEEKRKTREGSGLGLSICKHLVELHHGSIEVSSVLGKGTRFVVKLPANEAFQMQKK